jgi:hypothetical protein
MDRREFIKKSTVGLTALVVGSQIRVPWQGSGQAYAADQELNFTITDATKQMATHIPRNNATCYFWVFKDMEPRTDYPTGFPAAVPGPRSCHRGDTISITLNNDRNASGKPWASPLPAAGQRRLQF